MASTVIENLVTKLSLDTDQKALTKFNGGIKKLSKSLTLVVAAAGAAGAVIFAFTERIARSHDQLGKLSQSIGIDIEALQELGYVAELNGGSIESMNSSLANLSKIASEAARGTGAGVEVFGLLGVSLTDAEGNLRNVEDLLFDVSDEISRLGSQAERLELAQKLGIGEDLLLSIQDGSEALRRQREEAKELGFVIDTNAAKAAADFNDALLRSQKIVSGVANAIGTRLMKQITPMIEQFTKWFKANRQLLQQDIGGFLEGLTGFITGVKNVVMRVIIVIDKLVQGMGGWKVAILAVIGVLTLLNATALLIPLLVAALAAGIILLIEDVQKFMEGGDSVIGDLAKKVPIVGDAVKFVVGILKKAVEGWKLLFSDPMAVLEGINITIREIGDTILNFFIKPINALISLLNKIPGIDIGKLQQSTMAWDYIKNQAEENSKTRINPIPEHKINQVANNNTSTVNNSPKVIINVQEGSKENVENAVESALQKRYSSAQTNLASNVDTYTFQSK